MKFILLKRKNIIVIACSAFAFFMAFIFGTQGISSVLAGSRKQLAPICNVETTQKSMAVSFDMEGGNQDTKRIIDILNKSHVKATFFVTGDWADQYPESVRALTQQGHEVCNHSDTHPHMTRLYRDEMVQQITDCNEKIKASSGIAPALFRPPYGEYNNTLLEVTKGLNMYAVNWDVDSLDWKNSTPPQIYRRVITQVKPGSIVLFHNGSKNTPVALQKILQRLQFEDYTIIPVSELICRNDYIRNGEGVQTPLQGLAHLGGQT